MIPLNVWGIILVVCRIYDAYKYHLSSAKIRKVKTAKGHSRDFGNIALGVDFFMLVYFIFYNFDWYMIVSTIVMIAFVIEYWLTVYFYYPYRMRGCVHFKRPHILKYFINSIQSDRTRKRL